MMHWSLTRNTLIIGGFLAAALAVAVGCPSASNSPAPLSKAKPKNSPPSQEIGAPPTTEVQTDTSVAAGPGTPSAETVSQVSEPPTPPEANSSHPGESPDAQTPAAESIADAAAASGETASPRRELQFPTWPAPKFALFITGRQSGYLEPCGCAGLTNQKGGLARRHTFSDQVRAQGWPLVAVDTGNQVRRYGRQAEIQFQVAAEALKKMDYQAVALGANDLRLSSGELIAVVTDTGGRPGPFMCANANLIGLTKTHVVVPAGDFRVGVTSILGSEQLKQLQSDEIEKSSPEEGLQKVLPQLENAGCDLLVLLVNASLDEAKSLAEKHQQFDVVVAAAGSGEPSGAMEQIGRTQLIQVGEKSMYAGVLGVYEDEQNRFRYERVPLDDRFADSPFMLALLATYQDTLQSVGLEGLGLRPVQHPSGFGFVGSAKCGECHTQALEVWENTPHSHATETLVHPPERVHIARHFDPECLSCHVTGWDPQGYFPYKTGYLDLEKSAELHGNGCENCHGPGSQHVAAESGDLDLDEAAIQKLREAMRLPLAQAEKKCLECHDLDNDPHFQHEGAFEEYWEQIKHYGKD
jgi:hypothetical protein